MFRTKDEALLAGLVHLRTPNKTPLAALHLLAIGVLSGVLNLQARTVY